ncbi:ATP-dependent metallopeptidase FtsH/Yme1/Tma family protein [Anaerococcus sp. AGMB00486]|uniref:ATP-dependent zinc metalloprotease FtsH n=2 Tax=Anaerococcus TaxID=165779 RepID=A0ABX2N960_9FIRM|nr:MULTISPECIES: ATP-dependent zinc metalloprotease FtsH [Anaerococcus]MDY3005829.1 ATP-dependent zinc metalloprotease FtsH [Anaerococcus porci]MSS77570.1 ATP-dependent zinc metalloprotease FtsH [Anaerococcus porci]NVF11242.1 ATP-dependent metallopeptidase FtsH/Yme1/Tma family protein [Anaerococcus faecalis]
MLSNKKGNRPLVYYWIIAIVAFLVIRYMLNPITMGEKPKEVTYNQFVQMIDNDQVREVTKDDYNYTFTAMVDGDKKTFTTGLWPDTNLTERLLDKAKNNKNLTFTKEIETKMSPWLTLFITSILPLIFLLLIFYMANRSLSKTMGGRGGGDFMNFGKSNAKVYMENKTGKTFKDVAGQEEAKDSLNEVVDFLHEPQKYRDIGAVLPKGVLLVGPPGTGKTLLAKAVAGEANVPFFSISGSEFVEMFVGMGASKVRDLFKQAKEKAPCIVFIDEIDAIGKRRDTSGFSGNDEREQTLNQLLNEMDGFDAAEGVVLLSATNRPEILDPALTRPGRFDRQVRVELPDLNGRKDILIVHAKNVKREDDIDYEEIARRTAGTSGADLANIVNEGALRAVREGRKKLTQVDLEESIETVIAGAQKKNAVISDDQKKIIAYHEVGHALVTAIQTQKKPVTKITIVPRTSGALGYTMSVDRDEKYIMTKKELFDEIVTFAGGRSAEELIFNTKTTGASNDIERATQIARAMVTQYGMDDDFDFVQLERTTGRYLGGEHSLIVSSGTGDKIDEKVIHIISQAHMRAIEILKDNLDKLHEISDFLLKEETITGEQFMEILNKKPVEVKVKEEIEEKESTNENSSDEISTKDEEKIVEEKNEEDNKPIELGSSEDDSKKDE